MKFDDALHAPVAGLSPDKQPGRPPPQSHGTRELMGVFMQHAPGLSSTKPRPPKEASPVD